MTDDDVHHLGTTGMFKLLSLAGCTSLTNVSSLVGVYQLDLGGCSGIRSVSDLKFVKHLYLIACHQLQVTELINLSSHVPNITLCKCFRSLVPPIFKIDPRNFPVCEGVEEEMKLTNKAYDSLH